MVQRKEDLNSNFFRASGIYDAQGVADEEPNTGNCFPEGTVFRVTTPDTVDNVSDYNNFPLATITGGNKDHFALGLAMYCECQTGTNYGACGWIPVIWVHDTASEDDRAAVYASGRPNALTQNDFVKPLRPFSVSIARILCQGNQIDTNEWRNSRFKDEDGPGPYPDITPIFDQILKQVFQTLELLAVQIISSEKQVQIETDRLDSLKTQLRQIPAILPPSKASNVPLPSDAPAHQTWGACWARRTSYGCWSFTGL